MYIIRLCAKLHSIARRISFFLGLFCVGFISLYFSFLMAVKLPRSITHYNPQPLLPDMQRLYMYISRRCAKLHCNTSGISIFSWFILCGLNNFVFFIFYVGQTDRSRVTYGQIM